MTQERSMSPLSEENRKLVERALAPDAIRLGILLNEGIVTGDALDRIIDAARSEQKGEGEGGSSGGRLPASPDGLTETQHSAGWSLTFEELEDLHAAVAGVVTAKERFVWDEKERWERLGAWLTRLAVEANERFPGNWKGLPAENSAAGAPTGRSPDQHSAGWRDIESAPKDGTLVDLWSGRARWPDAYWGRPDHTCGEAGQYCDCCPTRDGWVDSTFNQYLTEDGEDDFTHWMPLPDPPAETGLSGAQRSELSRSAQDEPLLPPHTLSGPQRREGATPDEPATEPYTSPEPVKGSEENEHVSPVQDHPVGG